MKINTKFDVGDFKGFRKAECLFDRYFHCGEAKAKWLKEHSVPI